MGDGFLATGRGSLTPDLWPAPKRHDKRPRDRPPGWQHRGLAPEASGDDRHPVSERPHHGLPGRVRRLVLRQRDDSAPLLGGPRGEPMLVGDHRTAGHLLGGLLARDGYHWLTLYAASDKKLEPLEDMNAKPHLELNLYFEKDPEVLLKSGVVLQVASYHEELYNLASMYYWEHSYFDGSVHVEHFDGDVVTATVKGESDDDPVVLRANFIRNPNRRRSFR